MTQFQCTERELLEDFTLLRIAQISEYNHIQNMIAKEEEAKAKAQQRFR